MREILVTKEGYQQFFKELEKLNDLLASNAMSGSEAYKDAVGDGWHDNFAFEESMREHRSIESKINKMLDEKPLLKIVKEPKYDQEKINIGDIFEVKIKYEDDDVEYETLKLTGKYLPDTDNHIKEISLNSPLGSNIYLQNIKSTISYWVGNNKIEVEILDKKSL